MTPSQPASTVYNISPWESGPAQSSSPLDEFSPTTHSQSPPPSFATHQLLSTPDSGTLSRSMDEISPMFVETAGRQYKLTEVQIANLRALHEVVTSAGDGLSVADGSVRIMMQALQYESENRMMAVLSIHRKRTDEDTVPQAVAQDLEIRLDTKFELTKEQSMNIRKLSQQLIYHHSRTAFKALYLDVVAKIRQKPEQYRMLNVFGQPARETVFTSAVKCAVSGVRNGFRQDIRDSLFGNSKCSLEDFTVNSMHKYRPGSLSEKVNNGYMIHNSLLRRFAYENKHLLFNVKNGGSAPEASTGEKRTRDGGRVPNGEDFWARVDEWFTKHIEERESDLAGPLWKPYVEETILLDNQRFNSAVQGSTLGPRSAMVSSQAPTTMTHGTMGSNNSMHLPQVSAQVSTGNALLNVLQVRRGM